MRSLFLTLFALLLAGNLFAADKPNVLLICVDDLRPELNCFGIDYVHSPNIDALAKRGRIFQRHYVQAPTCGASRYTLLTGRYGSYGNGALFARGKELQKNAEAVPPSMPAWFRQHGYTTVSVGKVSHHPGGRGGGNWDDDTQPEMPLSWDRHLCPSGDWQHPRGFMHGLAHGEIRKNAKEMAVFQSEKGPDEIYPDGLTANEALKQMDQLSEGDKPFFLAVGILRPHLPFGAPAKYMTPYENADLPPTPHPEKPTGKTTWHGSGEFMKYNRWGRNPNSDAEFALACRKHYAACVTYADAIVGRLLKRLDDLGERENTIVVLWGDHGWHLGEHAVWGKHTLFEESLRSPLIVAPPTIDKAGEASNAVVETIDVFPTLCELATLEKPDFADGTSLVAQLEDPDAEGRVACSYSGGARTVRTPTHRLIAHRNGHLELYDHRTPAGETENVAEKDPETAKAMLAELKKRLD